MPELFTLLQTFFIKHITFGYKRIEHFRSPLPEIRGLFGIDPIPHGNNGIQGIEGDFPCYLTGTLVLNYSDFPNSSLFG